MKAIPKFLTFIALLSVINFAHASSLGEAYTVYRKASNANKDSPATASALIALENICKTSCGEENCKDEKIGKECSMYCGYIPDCSLAQGLKRGQAPYKSHLATTLGITSSDEEDIPNAPLPQEPITTSNSVSDKQANGNSPTEVIIRVVVDNPSAASCKFAGDKVEVPHESVSGHSSARPQVSSSPQLHSAIVSSPSAEENIPATEAPQVVQQPVVPQPSKTCTPEMKRRRQC